MDDIFYTPSDIAAKMIENTGLDLPLYVADFSAGGGELLRAAEEKWPESQFIATDISKAAVAALRRTRPHWHIGRCDFLSALSRRRCIAINNMAGKISLILLNPPFSGRGASYKIVDVDGKDVRCSQAVAFVLAAIPYLADNGQLIAILPTGCLKSEKDELAWSILSNICKYDVVSNNGHKTFAGCFPKTVIVKFIKGRGKPRIVLPDETENSNYKGPRVSIFRGRVPIHSINETSQESLPLIHSTELKEEGIDLSQRHARAHLKSISGPAVLLPRVGLPNKSKILLFSDNQNVILSDCVIAIKCRRLQEARKVKNVLLDNWSTLERSYTGTCARYITIKSLSSLLSGLGFRVSVER